MEEYEQMASDVSIVSFFSSRVFAFITPCTYTRMYICLYVLYSARHALILMNCLQSMKHIVWFWCAVCWMFDNAISGPTFRATLFKYLLMGWLSIRLWLHSELWLLLGLCVIMIVFCWYYNIVAYYQHVVNIGIMCHWLLHDNSHCIHGLTCLWGILILNWCCVWLFKIF